MKNLLLHSLLLITGLFAKSEQLAINLSGNGYVTTGQDGAVITDNGLEDWTSPESVISVYFYLHEPSKAELSLLAKGDSQIMVSYGKKSFKVNLHSEDYMQVPVGKIDIKKPGYVKVDLQGISKKGAYFGDVKQLLVDNVTGPSNYVKDFSDYWGRRGPSVHLAYTLPEGDTEWFYNEVTVPEEGETMHSYYMADGFREGYFGMQINSPVERRILFSVWSPYETEDPREIPDSLKIKMLRRGTNVHIGEFGNEGSGGQSYLVYPWKGGETYKFLMQVRPDENNNTIYTAYFFAPEENQWRLIASFLRPQTTTWYKHPHSFLENFNPDQGYLSREVMFGNQWARSKEGKWTRLTDTTFTHDATAKAGVRLDYQGGNTDDNRFYLKMGGFFDDSIPMGTKFYCQPTGQEPQIDFQSLELL
ncbi:MAG: DUF3472 domain-containing protein [Erysipelotrichales bacterium]|nr:DUF3472 domain-containing protein [Erysipelotrichales bacterium]